MMELDPSGKMLRAMKDAIAEELGGCHSISDLFDLLMDVIMDMSRLAIENGGPLPGHKDVPPQIHQLNYIIGAAALRMGQRVLKDCSDSPQNADQIGSHIGMCIAQAFETLTMQRGLPTQNLLKTAGYCASAMTALFLADMLRIDLADMVEGAFHKAAAVLVTNAAPGSDEIR